MSQVNSNAVAAEINEKKKWSFPHTYVILIIMVLLAAFLTYVVPAGQFEMAIDEVTGKSVVVPGTFHYVEQNPAGLFDIVGSIPAGLVDASYIVFFILIIGGAFQVITATGAIEAGIGKLATKLNGKEKLMIPLFVTIFAIGGGTIGMAEETIVFIPIGIILARALGFDSLTGTAMVIMGAACGFTSGFMNPFTVGVAQTIAELPLFSGMGLRLVVLVTLIAITSIYISRYGNRVKKDPSFSYVSDIEEQEKSQIIDLNDLGKITGRQLLVLLTLASGVGMIIWGVFTTGWYIMEIATVFMGIGILCGLVGGFGPSKIAEEFIIGAQALVLGALAVGIARAILILLQNGLVIDTIVNSLAMSIQGVPKSMAVIVMYLVQIVLNIFIPSGSGQAAVTMPIMTSIADILEINRQVAVLAFQFGDGFTNSMLPAMILALLSVTKISYQKWLKFITPLMGLFLATGAIFLVIANTIGYGPF